MARDNRCRVEGEREKRSLVRIVVGLIGRAFTMYIRLRRMRRGESFEGHVLRRSPLVHLRDRNMLRIVFGVVRRYIHKRDSRRVRKFVSFFLSSFLFLFLFCAWFGDRDGE